jgi:hypothetical protein
MENNNIVDLLRNVSVKDIGEGRKMIAHTNGAYIICNSSGQMEQRGFINNNPNPEHQYQKASYQQQQNRTIDNSFALEMYGLVNLCTGKTSTFDDIQTMAAYPSHRYQMASEQRSNNNYNNNRNAIELYELVQFIGGGNNINGW